MTIVGQAVRGMARSLNRLAGYEGEYDRKGVGAVSLKATIVVRDYELVDDEGFVTRVQSHDWLIVAGDLADLFPPQAGDRFAALEFLPEAPVGERNALFELMPLGKRPCYERHDSQGEMLVLHTKKVANAG